MDHNVRFEPLADHPREAFSCAYRPIQHFFRKWAFINHQSYAQRVYVACTDGSYEPIGFYSLTLMTFESSMETEAGAKYKERKVPTIYIAALARDKNKSESGFGSALLTNAFERCLEVRERVGVYAVSLHAANEQVASIYENYGFRRFEDGNCLEDSQGNSMPAMFIRLADISQAFAEAEL